MEFIKVRKRPVLVEAVQLTRQIWLNINVRPLNHILINKFILKATYGVFEDGSIEHFFNVQTLEDCTDLHKASINDWLIKGVNGEIYACKPDILEKTYELLYE